MVTCQKAKLQRKKPELNKINNYQAGLGLKLAYEIQKSFENIESLNAQKTSTENNLHGY